MLGACNRIKNLMSGVSRDVFGEVQSAWADFRFDDDNAIGIRSPVMDGHIPDHLGPAIIPDGFKLV